MTDPTEVLAAAGQFILREARLLDRHRFAFHFRGGPADAVVAALRPYRNADGGFGHGLEPDLRAAASQPVPVEHALQVLDEVGRFAADVVTAACDWLESVSTPEGGVPFVLRSVAEGPHAPWWVPTGEASPNPTAGIAGVLHKHRFAHGWLARATDYCWRILPERVDELGPDDAISVLTFLEHAPDRNRARPILERVGERIRAELVALDPDAPGYVKGPLDFAPHPDAPARRLFDDSTVQAHLDALAAKQEEDGGWPISWEPPSLAAVNEWRGFMTVESLGVLASTGACGERADRAPRAQGRRPRPGAAHAHSKFVEDEPPTAADGVVAEVTAAFLDGVLRRSHVSRPRVDAEVAALESEGVW